MFDLSVLALVLAAVSGMAVGAVCFRSWALRAARKKKRLPEKWQLQARPLLSEVENEVWHWLKRVFFDHHVLVKIPVTRFMAPRTSAVRKRSYELLSDVYCTFTVCAADGTAIGCLDLPGPQGLKASNRDLKQRLFAECGMAYAVVRASNLPTLEEVRAEFLGEIELPDDEPEDEPEIVEQALRDQWEEAGGDASVTEPAALDSTSGVALPAPEEVRGLNMQSIDMSAIAAARSSLRAKLERNRKIRVTGFDPLNTSSGIVQDNADHNFAQPWEDSFTPPEGAEEPPAGR